MVMLCVSSHSLASHQNEVDDNGMVCTEIFATSAFWRGENEIASLKRGVAHYKERLLELAQADPAIEVQYAQFVAEEYEPRAYLDRTSNPQDLYSVLREGIKSVTNCSTTKTLVGVAKTILDARMEIALGDPRANPYDTIKLKAALCKEYASKIQALDRILAKDDRDSAKCALRCENALLDDMMGYIRARVSVFNECRAKRLFLEKLQARS
ncbi:MAG: hypothetical protein C0514_07880 [Candidatus Puniceispirillum sp.]|nr:hypothetical protein [Candidatus Puniceispirillum sp.]